MRTAGAPLLASLCLPAAALAEVQFTPYIDVGVIWTDNIAQAGPDQARESEYVGRLNPGFTLTQKARRFQSSIEYALQSLFFANDSDRNTSYHSFDANASLDAIQDYLTVDANAAYSQQLIDPTIPTNLYNLYDASGLTDVFTYRATPTFKHRYGDTLAEASYTYGKVNYSGVDVNGVPLQDATITEARASLGSADDDPRLIWNAEYDRQSADYGQSISTFDYQLAQLDLGLRVLRTVRLLATGGVESDFTQDLTGGGLDAGFWYAGFSFTPDPQTEWKAMYGHRKFGSSYNALVRGTRRNLEYHLSYSEAPTTEAQEYGLRPLGTLPGPNLQPGDRDAFHRITNNVYLRKNMRGGLTLKGRRTQLLVDALSERRKYLQSGASEDLTGGGVSVVRTLNSRSQVSLNTRYYSVHVLEGGEYREKSIGLAYSRKSARDFEWMIAGSHDRRDGDTLPYRLNLIFLSLRKSF